MNLSTYQPKSETVSAFRWLGTEGHSEEDISAIKALGDSKGILIKVVQNDAARLQLVGDNGTWSAMPGDVVVIHDNTYYVFSIWDDFASRYVHADGPVLEAPSAPGPDSEDQGDGE